jgi:hypothetical protein
MALFKSASKDKYELKQEGYWHDTKQKGFGVSPANPQDWGKMKGGLKNEYWKLKGQLLYDPALLKMEENLETDFRGLGQSVAMGQADQASNAVSNALSARGGGNIASALTMGAQARVGAGLQGLQMGMQMEMGALGQYLQSKWATLTALFGKQAGNYQAELGAKSDKYSADKGFQAAFIPSLSGNKEF